jgi:hypothetical protein
MDSLVRGWLSGFSFPPSLPRPVPLPPSLTSHLSYPHGLCTSSLWAVASSSMWLPLLEGTPPTPTDLLAPVSLPALSTVKGQEHGKQDLLHPLLLLSPTEPWPSLQFLFPLNFSSFLFHPATQAPLCFWLWA